MGDTFNVDTFGEHPTLFSAREEGIVFDPGERVGQEGRFRVIEALGGGGMGIVYQVEDTLLDGDCKALKVILPSLMRSEKAQERFLQEARIAQRLAHPNIVTTFDIAEHQGIRFLTMEFLEGRNLAEELARRKTLPLEATLRIAVQVLRALEYAHKSTIHRDIKPQNIFVCRNGTVKLLDFGLARVAGSNRFTESSAAVGTAVYMAPEQLQGQETTVQSDLYSLGVVLYQCLTGKLPLGRFAMPSELDPNLPGWVDSLLDGLLSVQPEERPGSARELRTQLEDHARQPRQEPAQAAPATPPTPPSPAKRKSRLRAALALLVLLGILGIAAYRFLPAAWEGDAWEGERIASRDDVSPAADTQATDESEHPTATDASTAKIAAQKAQSAAQSEGAAEHAASLLSEAEALLKRASAHDTLEEFDQAVPAYEAAEAKFEEASAQAAEITAELAALAQAKEDLQSAKAAADQVDAAQWAKARYEQAERLASQAKETADKKEAAALYQQATERYGLALEETQQQSEAIEAAARNSMQAARGKAEQAEASQYAASAWNDAEGLAKRAGDETDPQQAKDFYAQAESAYTKAAADAAAEKERLASLPAATVQNVRVDPTAKRDGKAGIQVLSDFRIERIEGAKLEVAAYVYEQGGKPAPAQAGPYRSSATKGAYVGQELQAKGALSEGKDWALFLPDEAFAFTSGGKKDLEVEVVVWHYAADGTTKLASSDRVPFTYEAQGVGEREGGTREGERPPEPEGDARTRTVDLGNGVSLDLVWIPPGNFLMGPPPDKNGGVDDEGPRHRVTISKGFWMGKYEVTQAQWEAVMGNNPSYFKGSTNPVEQVSWDDCQSFIQKLNSHTGESFRLPTEAEWEYACRAGTTTPFYTGETISSSQANYRGTWTYHLGEKKGEYREMTVPVGSFSPNPWGLYDMYGNVFEWCQDRYGDYPNGSVTDPVGPGSGSERVCRGSGWASHPGCCRSAYRYSKYSDDRYNNLGFRLAR